MVCILLCKNNGDTITYETNHTHGNYFQQPIGTISSSNASKED